MRAERNFVADPLTATEWSEMLPLLKQSEPECMSRAMARDIAECQLASVVEECARIADRHATSAGLAIRSRLADLIKRDKRTSRVTSRDRARDVASG